MITAQATKAEVSHLWLIKIVTEDGAELPAVPVFNHRGCRWPLCWLPFSVRDRFCRDKHQPTTLRLAAALWLHGWEPVDEHQGGPELEIVNRFACPDCAGLVTVTPVVHAEPMGLALPADLDHLVCAGTASCGWSGTGTEFALRIMPRRRAAN